MDSDQLINIGLYGAFALLAIAAISAIVMNLINSLSNTKSLIKSGIGIVVLVVIFFIGYSMAPTEFDSVTSAAFEAAEIDPTAESTGNLYKLVGGAMTTTLVLFVLAVVGLVYSSVARIFN